MNTARYTVIEESKVLSNELREVRSRARVGIRASGRGNVGACTPAVTAAGSSAGGGTAAVHGGRAVWCWTSHGGGGQMVLETWGGCWDG